jgi:hypothetical protein
MGQDGVRFVDSWMDVSPYVNKRFREFVASQQVKARLLGQDQPDMNEVLRGIKSLSTMKLRARFNMMDGPLYIRTDDPLTLDELDMLVASKSNDEYQEFVKRFRARL